MIRRRPVLALAVVLAALPAVYVALIWARVVPEAYLRFTRPWAALLALPAMAFVAARLAAHRVHVGRARQLLSDALVSLAVIATALAATGPELGRPLDRLTIIVVVDRSRSIDLVVAAQTRVERELSFAQTDMRDDDLIGKVVFGANAATEEPPRPKSTLPTPQQADIGRDGTDIAAGIKHALAEVPADSAARLVLISDGVATRGDVMGAAAAALASEIPIDVIPLEQRDIPDVRVVSFRTASRAHEGETLGMRVVISSPRDAQVELRLRRDGKLVQRVKARVAAGEDVITFPEPAGGAGLHRYDVEVTADDPSIDESADDNSQSAFVRVRGPARALVVDGDAGKTAFIASALEQAGFRVEQGGLSALPGDIGGMAAYDLIVFGDVPALDLAPPQVEALASYARDLGGGLLLTGGDRSFGPGGYARTPLEEVSPVSFDLKQEQRRASLAEVIAIDISGSMAMRVGAQTKLELANEAAARSADLLGKGDHIGVVHVDTDPHWAVKLQPVTDIDEIKRAIRSVGPGGGGILVDVALAEAYRALAAAKVNLKHVLLFADGADAENITAAVQASVETALRGGITTSVVSLGRGHHSAALEDLSRRGDGRFYIVEDASRLPAVFAQETVLASRSAVVEKDFVPRLKSAHAMVRDVDMSEAPPLRGYVVTIPKPRSSVILDGPESDPILAAWSVGLGQVGAFTSDLKDRWGGAWTHWPGAARMLVQAGRDLARRDDDTRVRLDAEVSGGQMHLRATVVGDDGRLQSFRRLRVAVHGPDGYARDVALDAAGPGSYAASVPLSHPGAYIAVARDEVGKDGAGGVAVATTGAVLTAGDELRPTGSDEALLRRIAELTHGRARDTLAGIFRDRAALRFAYRNITEMTLLFAALAFLLAIAARRLALPEGAGALWVEALINPFRRKPTAAGAPGGATAQATLDQLLAAKQDKRDDPPAEASSAEALAAARRPPPEAPSAQALAAARRPPPEAHLPPPPRAATPRPPAPAEPTPGERKLTAAEILLERRKRNKP